MKLKIICGILALVMISSGVIILTRPPEEVVITPPDNAVNTVMDKPADGDPSTIDPKHSLYVAQGELLRAGGFKGSSIGSSTSMGVKQEVASERTVVGNNAFKQSTSYSSLVKFGEQLYVWEENYLSRRADKVQSLNSATWKNTAKKYTKDGWFDKIGYRCNELTGYILNDGTILDATLEKIENGLYTFRYVLDTETAPYYVLHEMRNNAGTEGFAKFEKCEIVVTMDKNWIVQTLTTDCRYKVTLNSVMQNLICTESLTETFYEIGYKGDLPYKEFFENFFNSDVTNDDEKELTAVDALMGMFEPYMGANKLYADVNITNGANVLTKALICANIDVANTENITFDVKIGNDLFVAYNKNGLYLTYQDFKASTTVDGILGFIQTLTNITSPEKETPDGKPQSELDLESLLGGLELIVDKNDDTTTVHLPMEVGGITIDVKLVAAGTEKGKLSFANAHVEIGDVSIDVTPTEKWNVPAIEGEYPELLGLTKLLNNGAISLNAKIENFAADMTFDIATKSLYVKCDGLGLNAALINETLFASVGEAKIKFALKDVDDLMQILSPFVKDGIEMPELDLNAILAALLNVTATKTDDGVRFYAEAAGISLEILLTSDAYGWNLDSIEIKADETCAIVAPTERFETPEINADEYVDVTEVAATLVPSVEALLNADGYRAELNLSFYANGKTYDAFTDLLYDKYGNVQAAATVSYNGLKVLSANVVYANGTLYVEADGLKIKLALNKGSFGKAKFAEGNTLEQLFAQFKGYNDGIDEILDLVCGIATDFDLTDIGDILGKLAFSNDALTLNFNATKLGLSDFYLTLGKAENGLNAAIKNLAYKSMSLDLTAEVAASNETVAAPDGDFRTDIAIQIDKENTLYANLDLVTNVYRFALENSNSGGCLYIIYSDGSFKIVKPETAQGVGDAISASGNIAAIKEVVTKIDYMVKQLSNGLPIEFNPDGSAPDYAGGILGGNLFDGALDVKQLIKSIQLSASQSQNTLLAKLSVSGLNVELTVKGGDNPKIENVRLPIEALGIELNVRPSGAYPFIDFDKVTEYVEIDKVLEDYFPTITELVMTNCWKFEFTMDSQIDIYDAASGVTDSFRIAQGSYVEFFYNRKLADEFTMRAFIKIQIPSADGNSWQDLVTLDVLFGKDEYAQQRLWITYNNDLKLTVAMDSVSGCMGLFDELKAAIPQIGALIDSMSETMSQIQGNLENVDYTTIIRSISYDNETSVFDLTLNAGVLLSNLGDISLQISRDENSMTLNKLTLSYSEYDKKNALTKSVSVLLQGLKVSSAERITENFNNQVNTPDDYEIANLSKDYFATYGLYNGDTGRYNTSNFISFDSLPELLKAVIDTANKTTFAIDGLITAKLDVSSYVGDMLSGAVKLSLPLMLSVRVDRVQHEDGKEDVYIAAMLQRFDSKASILGMKYDVYNDAGGQSYLYYDSTVEYTDSQGKTQHGWFWVSRYPNTNQTSDEPWTETTLRDVCNDCNAEASENCYLTYCNLCGKEADDNCKTVGYCTECKKVADENCYVDFCTNSDCNKPWDECSGWKHAFHAAWKRKAHGDKVHTADSVRAPHTVNTVIEQTDHTSGKPVLGNAEHSWNGSVEDFTTGTVENNGYTITNIENELYEMLNLGTIKLLFGAVKLDLEQIIVSSIHGENAGSNELTAETILGNLQNILKNYEYVVPQGNGDGDDPFFRIKADLSSINGSFGMLDLTIGHTVSYAEKQVENAFGEVATQKVVDKLNLKYLRGTFRLANVLDANFQLTLAQNWEDYAGDAQYFVQHQPLWDASDHASNFR
ncbi:MAG: hypothetical protein NC132_01840 [Corallococcus sp.]|nr:hypothetical protein [Corallococcus sp.]MCM1359400.1 hypothetical protein [Corallococcus sp.]MCM1394843.1 hypothetical protein [Corallococcus sp.]